ncbi:MAG TPA: avidin/streptavidin family protein [Acidimicrobiales bacterium]|nr:avidin/streptavidin family protein [Acidimicrobiales bacterium]
MDERANAGMAGTWHSDLGSELHLELDGDRLAGTYHSAIGCECREHPVTGFCNWSSSGDAATLAFVVPWPVTRSVTTWAGRYDSRTDTISALWLLATEAPAAEAWRSTTVGHDAFHRA